MRHHLEPPTSSSSTKRALRAALAACSVVTTLTLAGSASADLKACTDAHATGQRESKAGHLRASASLFTKCGSDESCPQEIRRECTELLDSVRGALPTVIFSVVDAGKRDVGNVKVFSDDELIADGLDGRAVEIDPGKHHLRFVLPWGQVLGTDVIVREGEKNRMIQMDVGDDATAPEQPPAEAAAGPKPGPPLGAWIATGVGAAALATGVTFAILGSGKQGELDDCKPNCSPGKKGVYDNAKTMYLIGDIGFGVAAVSAVVATWLFLAPRTPERRGSAHALAPNASPGKPRFTISGGPTPGGGQLGVTGQF